MIMTGQTKAVVPITPTGHSGNLTAVGGLEVDMAGTTELEDCSRTKRYRYTDKEIERRIEKETERENFI